ncbi:MAG: 3'-5' exonuclease [Negativicutes bacterium]|nr:3'-5' exonuclease [Negativicutes bacterium]
MIILLYPAKNQIKNPLLLAQYKQYCLVDIETSGLDPARAEIVELACSIVSDARIIGDFSVLLRPSQPMSEEVIAIHGIRNEDVESAFSPADALARFEFYIGDLPLVAHNANFDFTFIQSALGYPLPNALFDSMALAQLLLPAQPHYSVSALCAYFNIVNEQAHRALSDCHATAEIVIRLLRQYAKGTTTAPLKLYKVVEPNTYQIRAQLKAAGFRWYQEQRCWGIEQPPQTEQPQEIMIQGFLCRLMGT